ncbi:MAG: nucleoside deaminase [Wenzhouxiangella sp.]|jgi:tRNA(Arg) A34 adenosine deaminase TadA|nr:nucleoside deaminase [Wenzhouxiangella sp.]
MQTPSIQIHLPAWINDFVASLPPSLDSAEERMRVAISLSEQNVAHDSGGPFGALVVAADSGRVLAVGVNRVEPGNCSSAHAEIVALSLAQQRLGMPSLAATGLGPVELVSSCEPCAMCLGAVPWSGVSTLLCGATKVDAEAAGFDEGDRSDQWIDQLAARGVEVRTEILRSAAAEVISRYARSGRRIY